MNKFLAKTTRPNAMNLKWLPLDFKSKVPFTETCPVSVPSLKGFNFYCSKSTTSQHCWPSPGIRESNAVCQGVHSVVSTLFPFSGLVVAPLPCCACSAPSKEAELGSLSWESLTQQAGSLWQGQISRYNCKKQKKTEPSLWSNRKILSWRPRGTKGEVVQESWDNLTACCHQKWVFHAASKSWGCQISTTAHAKEGSDNYSWKREVSLAFGAATSSNFSGIFSLCGACCNPKCHEMLLDWDKSYEERFAWKAFCIIIIFSHKRKFVYVFKHWLSLFS